MKCEKEKKLKCIDWIFFKYNFQLVGLVIIQKVYLHKLLAMKLVIARWRSLFCAHRWLKCRFHHRMFATKYVIWDVVELFMKKLIMSISKHFSRQAK